VGLKGFSAGRCRLLEITFFDLRVDTVLRQSAPPVFLILGSEVLSIAVGEMH
jgi:hypothetical protein